MGSEPPSHQTVALALRAALGGKPRHDRSQLMAALRALHDFQTVEGLSRGSAEMRTLALRTHLGRLLPDDETLPDGLVLPSDTARLVRRLAHTTDSITAAGRTVGYTDGTARDKVKNAADAIADWLLDRHHARVSGTGKEGASSSTRGPRGNGVSPWAPTGANDMAPVARMGVHGRIVGRDDELTVLSDAWERTVGGHQQVAVVGGEPGVGKTRLVAELGIDVADTGGVVLWGPCDENNANPYQPFTEALDGLVRRVPTSVLDLLLGPDGSHLVPLLPILRDRLPELVAPPSYGSDHDRFQMYDAVASLLARASDLGPLLVVVEDLHWASDLAIGLLRHCLGRTLCTPTMFVTTYRPNELTDRPAVHGLLTEMMRAGAVNISGLRELSVDALHELVEDANPMGRLGDTDEIATMVAARAGGNPLWATQLLRHYADSNPALRRRLVLGQASAVPRTVEHLINQRLDRLPTHVRAVLQHAAVAGDDVELAVLERLPDLATAGNGPTVLDALEAALDARLLNESTGGGRFRFVHALVRETLHASLTATRHARIHHQIADILVELGRPAPDIAHHYVRAVPDGTRDQAIHWLHQAAEHHMAAFAREEAQHALETALELVNSTEHNDRGIRARTLFRLARLAGYQRDQESQIDLAEQAARDAIASGAIHILIDAIGERNSYGNPGVRDPVVDELLHYALDMVPDDRPDLRSLLEAHRAHHEAITNGRGWSADDLAAKAVASAYEVGDPAILQVALGVRALILQGSPDLRLQRMVCDEMKKVEHRNHPHLFNNATLRTVRYPYEAMVALQAGDIPLFDRKVAATGQVAETRQDWMLASTVAMWQATRALLDGRLEDVAPFADEMMAIGGHYAGIRTAWMAIQLILAHEQGRMDDLQLDPAMQSHIASMMPTVSAMLHAYSGRFEAAHASAHHVIASGLADVAAGYSGSSMLAVLADVDRQVHDPGHARELHRHLEPYAGQLIVSGWGVFVFGAADRHLATLSASLERWDEANARFAAALQFEQSLPSPPLVARTKAYWGAAILEHGTTNERQRGLDLLAEATIEGERIGMKGLRAQALSRANRTDSRLPET